MVADEADELARRLADSLAGHFPGGAFRLESKQSRSALGTALFVLHYFRRTGHGRRT